MICTNKPINMTAKAARDFPTNKKPDGSDRFSDWDSSAHLIISGTIFLVIGESAHR